VNPRASVYGLTEAHGLPVGPVMMGVQAGGDPREIHDDITQATLMAFAGVNCRSAADELALLSWRATRLAGVLGALTSPARSSATARSGDALMSTMRLTAVALSGMATAAHAAADPARGAGEAAGAGQSLAKAMTALEEAAKDASRHRAAGDLMGMVD
jgi:hypothetical protein